MTLIGLALAYWFIVRVVIPARQAEQERQQVARPTIVETRTVQVRWNPQLGAYEPASYTITKEVR